MSGRFQHIAVLMGGWSAERDVSLVSGAAVADALEKSGYTVTRIDVTHDLPTLIAALTPKPDAVFNALHGKGGEDGVIQGVLEMLQIPYTHSGVLASAIAMDKPLTKALLRDEAIPSPDGMEGIRDHLKKRPFALPYVVKPADEGSSVGVHIVQLGDNRPVWDVFAPDARLMVEQYIPGRELTVGVQGMAGEKPKAMAVTEIRTHQGFYDYENKYTDGRADHIVPAEIPDEIARDAMRLAELAHFKLGCSGVTRSDFRWDDAQPGTNGLYFLEINMQPGMTGLSLVPEQAAYLGMSFTQLVVWLIEGARCHA